MATADQILALRKAIGEPDDSNGYTDAILGAYIDEGEAFNLLVVRIWDEKAASFSRLVNISESGSSRSMGDLYKNAIAMSKYYRGLEDASVVAVASRPRTRRIVRRDQT